MDPILLKTLAAVVLGFAISAILGKFLVPALRRWKAGQSIKEDGPTWHMSKQGTPTMGGLMFIAAVVVVVLVLNGPAILAGDLTSVFVLLLALVFGLIGFVDDYAKIKKKENTGLTASQKFLLQLVAAILFIVAYNMCQWRTFLQLVKTAPKSDILVLVVTFVLTVVFDLVVAIEIGMILACLLFIKRMSEETKAESWVYTDDDTVAVNENLRMLPAAIRVYEVSGPLFFGASDAIEHIIVEESAKCLVLRMRAVPALDSTAMNALTALTKTCESKGVTIVFSHVNEQPMKAMKKAGFTELVGAENFCPNITAALERAEEIIK